MTSRVLGPIVIKSHASPAPKPRGESVTCYSDLDGAVIVKAEEEPA